ncbi:MAG: deoxyguanosinetriphosphate triphosphohydrolase [Candidatus Saganbacteria bacterium]|nr:deoxyguanosinetriphosphate triphosphohydrolase [Candidatus Saganbacteria bacterium]
MQTIREAVEKKESQALSKRAALSCKSRGRLRGEKECDIRTAFQHDRDRIIHSKAFRRLKHKTQVFIAPSGDHYRTRLTHTLEVSQIGRTIARALGLNEDLTEAIALGHDLGHTPFGHAGEAVLDSLLKKYGLRFFHNEQSLHVIDDIERLNLTREVRDGILNHPWTFPLAKTLEGQIVRFADRIAYINHDIDDSIRSGVLKREQIPEKFQDFIGRSPVDVFVKDVVNNSSGRDKICMGRKGLSVLNGLYGFMYRTVYTGPRSKNEEKKIYHVLSALFGHYMSEPSGIPDFKRAGNKKTLAGAVRDFIAGMTDRYALSAFETIFVPSQWNK